MNIKMPPDWQLFEKRETSSTNDEAKKLPEGSGKTAICARIQTGGRGRMGRRWISPEGNLYVSFCLEPVRLDKAGIYSFLSALSLAQSIERLCPSLQVKCKWPNDLLVKGKKISGILLETDGIKRLIAGIGVNLVPCPQTGLLYPVTSLSEEGYHITTSQMLESLLERFDFWNTCVEKQGTTPLLAAWSEKAYGVGRPIRVNLPNEQLSGIFDGLDKEGSLLLNKDGEIIKITAGDVFFDKIGKDADV